MGEKQFEPVIAHAADWPIRGEVGEWAGFPSGLFKYFSSRCHFSGFSKVNFSGRDFPAPSVGDKSMAPKQQHTAIGVVHHNASCGRRHPNDVMFKSVCRVTGDCRDLHVGEGEGDPLGFVDISLVVNCPSHGVERYLADPMPPGMTDEGRTHGCWACRELDCFGPPIIDDRSGQNRGKNRGMMFGCRAMTCFRLRCSNG